MKKLFSLLSVTFSLCALVAKTQNVGINNTNPQAALDLQGDLRLRSAILTLPAGLNNDVDLVTQKSSVYMFGGGALTINACQITGFTGGVDGRIVTIFNNSTIGAIQLYDANFSISPSAAANKILTGTGNNVVIFSNGSATLRYDGAKQKWTVMNSNYTAGLDPNPSPWLILGNNIGNSNTANVGIGTINPQAKLEITGNIKITDGTQGEGKVLTSDVNGAATWRSNSGSIGFGSWGDCSMNNISEYNPVVDATSAEGFGLSVSISGNYAIVGAFADVVGGNISQGSASIYQWSGGNWVLMQKITDPTGTTDDRFGRSVSISSNYAIVGASGDDNGANIDQGSVSIYQLSGGTWVFMQKLIDATGATNDFLGKTVSISGNYFIVGSFRDDIGANVDQGSASIYQLSGGTWVLMQKMTDATGATADLFGFSVSISDNYAIVGAYDDNVGTNTAQGSASIYQLSGGTWVLIQKITDADGVNGDNFGNSVSISGNYTVVGAPNDDVGANINQGSTCIYRKIGNNWVQMQKITNAVGTTNDNFGSAVSMSGDFCIIGSSGAIVGTFANQGTSTVYQRLGLGWNKFQYIIDPAGNPSDKFGAEVSIDNTNKRFIIGVPGYFNKGKAVFGKLN